MTSNTRTAGFLAAMATVALVALAAPAQAIYIMTPLQLHVDETQVEVGDTVNLTVNPQNETMAQEWANRSIRVTYAWDRDEGAGAEEPDAATSNDSWTESVLLDALVLDENANATFTWTIPPDVQDRNVDVRLLAENGELLGVAHLAVGDAEPQMRILAGSGPGEPEPDVREGDGSDPQTPADVSDAPSDGERTSDGMPSGNDDGTGEQSPVPGPGAFALVGTLVVTAAGLALARRERD